MFRKLGLMIGLVACLGVFLSAPVNAQGAAPGKAGIEGTWKLVSRDLPDGTTQTAPEVMGLLTFRDGHRNFNVYWVDAEGNPVSISMISTYSLGDKEYTETCLYAAMNEPGKEIAYDLSGASGKAAVARSGKKITIDMPLFGEPVVVFEGDTMTATREGAFVDHWVRVK